MSCDDIQTGTMLFNHVMKIAKEDGNIDCIFL